MARRSKTANSPTKPLLKTPVRVGSLDAAAEIGRLRHLHEEAEDPSIERMPEDKELFGALLYLEKHANALRSTESRQSAALTRVRLWEYLREQADLHQAQAVSDARAAHVEWAELASALAVNTPSAAYNKAARLRAAALSSPTQSTPPVRRTPEAVAAAERRLAAEAAAELKAQQEASRRHTLLVPVAQRLLDHRDGLSNDEEVVYWLDEIAEVLPHCETPTQKASLNTFVHAAVRELRRVERSRTAAVAGTEEARLAYAAACELCDR